MVRIRYQGLANRLSEDSSARARRPSDSWLNDTKARYFTSGRRALLSIVAMPPVLNIQVEHGGRAHKKGLEPLRAEAISLENPSYFLFGSFSIPRRHGVIGIAHAAAHIHEAAAPAVVKCTSATRMIREAGARGNKAADDYVFLQTAQIVLEAPDRRFGEDAGGFLERRCRNEGFRGQGRLGNTQQHGLPGRLIFALGPLLRDDIQE